MPYDNRVPWGLYFAKQIWLRDLIEWSIPRENWFQRWIIRTIQVLYRYGIVTWTVM